MNTSNYPADLRDLVNQLLLACNYSIDIVVSTCGRSGLKMFEMHVFDKGRFGPPRGYDADMFESAAAGSADNTILAESARKWLYGHSGFDILYINSYDGFGANKKYIMSESKCFELFYDDLLNGYLNTVMLRLPRIGSAEELKVWLAAAGSLS